MAVVNLTTTILTSRNAGVLANAINTGAFVEGLVDQITVNNTDSIASTYRVLRVSSNALVTDAVLFNGAVTGAAADIGLYQTPANGGLVVDADFFAAAQSIATASAGTNVLGGNTATYGPANRGKRIWEVLGLTTDPQRDYDVVLTLTAAATATAPAGISLKYVI